MFIHWLSSFTEKKNLHKYEREQGSTRLAVQTVSHNLQKKKNQKTTQVTSECGVLMKWL